MAEENTQSVESTVRDIRRKTRKKYSAEEKTISRVVLSAGVVAGTISLVQAGVQQTLVNIDLLASAETPFRTLLALVNQIDTYKLMALALLSVSTSNLGIRTVFSALRGQPPVSVKNWTRLFYKLC